MKHVKTLSLAALLSFPTLAGCGLRGDLERPEPIFSEPVEEEVETKTVVTNRTIIRRNADGDIIPDASPTEPVSEGGLEDIE